MLVGAIGLVAVRLNLVERPDLVCATWAAGAVVNVVASFILLGPVFAPEPFAQTQALAGAAWAGVAGATAALGVCIGLAHRNGVGLRPATLGLVETWARQGERYGSLHRFVEQGAFAEGMLCNQQRLRLLPLSDRFHTMQDIDGSPPPADAVIVHLKSSRGERKSALPPSHGKPIAEPSNATRFATFRPITDSRPAGCLWIGWKAPDWISTRSEEHTSELQSH